MSEAKRESAGRGIARLLLFEGLAGAGLAHMLLYAPASNPYTLYFLYNAAAFLVLYPVIYLYKWIRLPGILRLLLTPLNIALHAAMLVSTFLWAGYAIFVRYPDQFKVLADGTIILWFFWTILYLAWGRYLLATSQKYVPFAPLLVLTMIVAAGGLGGFWGGRWVVDHWGDQIGSPAVRFMLWVSCTLVGAAGAGFLAPKRDDSGD